MKKTKKYYEPVKLVIPDSINYDELWKRIEDLKPLEKKQIKNSTYLFLSFLFPSEIYLSKYQKNGFHKNINSTEFNKLTRNRLTKVTDILYDIIDEDFSYLSGSYSKSYKLKDQYFYTATPKFVTIQSTISQNYFDYKRKKELEIKELNKKYDYLISQYEKSISLHPTVNDYIDKLEISLNQRLNDYSVNNQKLHSLDGIIQMKIRMMRDCVKKNK